MQDTPKPSSDISTPDSLTFAEAQSVIAKFRDYGADIEAANKLKSNDATLRDRMKQASVYFNTFLEDPSVWDGVHAPALDSAAHAWVVKTLVFEHDIMIGPFRAMFAA